MWNRRDSYLRTVQLANRAQALTSSQAARALRVSTALQVQGGDVFVGHFLIPKAGSCALKQLRFLSCSHGPSACLRTGNGAGLQTMSWILPSLKSLAEIPSTSYELCVAEGAPTEQSALSGQFSWTAWDCLVWGAWWGHQKGWSGWGAASFMDPCPEQAPC